MPDHDPEHLPADLDALARPRLAAAASLPALTVPRVAEEHHGAADTRMAARQRAEQARARRAAGAGKSRAYVFRRS